MNSARPLGSRLGVRIYLSGLAQFALVALGILLVAWQARRAEPSLDTLRLVAESVALAADDRAALASAVLGAERLLHTELAVHDEHGNFVAGTEGAAPPPPRNHPPHERPPPPPGDDHGWPRDHDWPPGPPAPRGVEPRPAPPPPGEHRPPFISLDAPPPPHSVPVFLRDGRVWQLSLTAQAPIVSFVQRVSLVAALVLLVAGASAWWTARGLARPLARLSSVARAFGAGDLTARAGLDRSDELGDVSAAFDEMAERVTRALRAEKELLANVSHELRTPLQRIQIAIDLASEGDAATARESLDDIAEDLAELGRIVEDVLSAARLSLEKGGAEKGDASPLPPLHAAPVAVAALVERSAARFRALHPSRALDVRVEPDLPDVCVDAVLVRRAIDNLLDNAHKYSDDAATTVVLEARVARDNGDNGRAVLEVRDHGVGISTGDLARVFEPFFRADRSRTRGSGGLGLGLLLARRIAVAHGGDVTVESVLGEGTTVRLELPFAAASAPRAMRVAPPQ